MVGASAPAIRAVRLGRRRIPAKTREVWTLSAVSTPRPFFPLFLFVVISPLLFLICRLFFYPFNFLSIFYLSICAPLNFPPFVCLFPQWGLLPAAAPIACLLFG
jgi:hypothetical protein